MPSKERLRRDHERGPPIAGECPAHRSKDDPIPVAKLRPTDRASQDLHLVAEDLAKPVTLALAIDYGVCEKICVPVDAKAELMLDGKPTAQDTRIAAAEARVPKPATLAQDDALSVRAVKREGSRMVVDVASPAGASVDLFAEGPTADWALTWGGHA